eukprot:3868285-Prymnesium_polylepis.2
MERRSGPKAPHRLDEWQVLGEFMEIASLKDKEDDEFFERLVGRVVPTRIFAARCVQQWVLGRSVGSFRPKIFAALRAAEGRSVGPGRPKTPKVRAASNDVPQPRVGHDV